MAVDWGYYDSFDEILEKYLPIRGEGETKATQIVTAVNKLIYKWYNDGDVFDNTHYLEGWANDLSSYANWLAEHTNAEEILDRIELCINDGEYEDLLREIADNLFDETYLAEQNKEEKIGSIYDCDGKFRFVEYTEEDEYEDEEDEEYYY